MHILPESPGPVLKTARERAEITIEALADKVNISERYLYRIENEGKKPSYDVLYRLIHELNLSSEQIFYPEKQSDHPEIDQLVYMLYKCDSRSLKIIKSVVIALLDTTPEKQP